MTQLSRTDGVARAQQVVRSISFPLLVWVVWRLVHVGIVVAAGTNPVDAMFFDDGGWYRLILTGGYDLVDPSYTVQQDVAFMPLIPLLARPLVPILGVTGAALLVANATGIAAFVGVYSVFRRWRSEADARLAVVGFALWPFSMFLWAFYTEAAFVAIIALGLIGIADRRPHLLYMAAFLAPLTRPIGVSFGLTCAIALVISDRRVSRVAVTTAVCSVSSLTVVALGQHLLVGDGLAFYHAQESWNRHLSAPWWPYRGAGSTIFRTIPTPPLEATVNLIALAVGWVALVVLIRKGAFRTHLAPALWATAAFVAPQFTYLYSSQARFMIATFPLLLALPAVPLIGRWRRAVVGSVLGVSAVGSVIVVVTYANGTFVG